MKESLLKYLCCPNCKQDFLLIKEDIDSNEEINTGKLQCKKCITVYPIINGIPRILPEAEISFNYSENFKMYWQKMDWNFAELYKKRFYEMCAWKENDFDDKIVLEAGCGGGRWVFQFAHENVKEIIAFDYTEAVDKAKEVCSKYNNIHYVQADLFKLPFKKESFDIVHCHGVLNTTPDVKKGVESLSTVVKEKGIFVFLVYRNLTTFQQVIDNVICYIPKRMPITFIYYISIIPTLIEYIPGFVRIFENFIHLSGQPNFTLKHLHNFDWYTCKYRPRTSRKEASTWLKKLDFKEVVITNTNDFRTDSKIIWFKKLKEKLLDKGFFLKATLGVRAKK